MILVYISIAILWICVIASYFGWLPMPTATLYGDDSHF